MFLPGESQGRGSLVGCRLWGHTQSDTTEVTAAAAAASVNNSSQGPTEIYDYIAYIIQTVVHLTFITYLYLAQLACIMALVSLTFPIKSIFQPLDPGIPPPKASNLAAAHTSHGWGVFVDLPSAEH